MRLPIVLAFVASGACANDPLQLDPFAQATAGYPACPAAHARMYTQDEARNQAHARVERGTRCAMEGTCEPGGAYRRDPEINDAVRAAIAGDKRFANTAVWVSTSRKWVMLEGCVRSASQRKALVKLVEAQPRVERVFDLLKVR
jgi:osmotically-inducible protein OsmY